MNQSWVKYLPFFLREKLWRRAVLQKVLENTGWLFFERMLRMSVGILVGAWVARYLGPKDFGTLNYAMAFISLFLPFSSLAMDSIVVRDIVANRDSTNETLGTAFLLKLVGSFVMLSVTVFMVSILHPTDGFIRLIVAIIAAGMIFQSLDVIDFWFQSQILSKYTVYVRSAAFFLATLCKVGLILTGASIVAFASVGVFEVAVGALGLVVTYRVMGHSMAKWRVSLKRVKELLSTSWPLLLSSFAIFVQARIDQVMLGEMIGSGEVGQYTAAMICIEGFGFVPVVICASIAPLITEAKFAGEEFYYARLLNIYRLMFILFLIIALPIYLFSDHIMITLFGDAYKEAGILLALFSLRLFFTNFGVSRSLFITNERLFTFALLTSLLGALLNVALNYVLIPPYASMGAIWATIVSFGATTFFIDTLYFKTRRNFQTMLKAILTPWEIRF